MYSQSNEAISFDIFNTVNSFSTKCFQTYNIKYFLFQMRIYYHMINYSVNVCYTELTHSLYLTKKYNTFYTLYLHVWYAKFYILSLQKFRLYR